MVAAIILICLFAGIVHGTVGFGAGIVIMTVMPLYFALPQAAGISSAVIIALTVQMLFVYRQYICWKRIVIPAVVYLAASSIAIHFSQFVNQTALQIAFGCFLICLCAYYLLRKRTEKKQLSLPMSVFAMVFSGVCCGLFGIGGPLMTLYYLGRSKDNMEYLATIQGFFLLTDLYNTVFRVSQGVLQAGHFRVIALGMVVIAAGGLIAKKIVNRLNPAVLTKCIYAMLGVSGVINIVSALL